MEHSCGVGRMWRASNFFVQQKKCQVMEKERCGEVEQDTGWAGRCEDKGREGDSVGSSVTRRTHTHTKKGAKVKQKV